MRHQLVIRPDAAYDTNPFFIRNSISCPRAESSTTKLAFFPNQMCYIVLYKPKASQAFSFAPMAVLNLGADKFDSIESNSFVGILPY
jgi:hypothetical protein